MGHFSVRAAAIGDPVNDSGMLSECSNEAAWVSTSELSGYPAPGELHSVGSEPDEFLSVFF